MREIKLRAWHIANKIMASVGDLNWSGKVHVSYKKGAEKSGYFFGGNNVGDDWDKDEHILMQFTGLTDKNGNERYESDIVKITWTKDSKGGYLQSSDATVEHEVIARIEFVHDRYAYIGADGKEIFPPKNSEVEVIGNIYEHTELLKSPN